MVNNKIEFEPLDYELFKNFMVSAGIKYPHLKPLLNETGNRIKIRNNFSNI